MTPESKTIDKQDDSLTGLPDQDIKIEEVPHEKISLNVLPAKEEEAEIKDNVVPENTEKKEEVKVEEKTTKKDIYPRRFNRVLFVVTDVSASYGKAMNPHLGIAMLMAYLEKNGVETEVIDLQLGYELEDVAKKAKEFNADLIGITMFSFDFVNTYKKVSKIKEMTGVPVVLGGAHISTVKGESLERTTADFGITRDGEIPLLQLCLGYPLDDIKSLVYRKKGEDGKEEITINTTRKLNWELDDLPFPAYEKFELERYIHFIDKRLPLETSRGCPYSCTYCDVKVSMGQAFRPRSPEHIVAEFKHWYDKGFRFFEFVDDVFTMDMERAEKVCDLIIASGMKFRWNCANGIRADRISEPLLRKMKLAGCEFVAYGLETGNPEMLKIIKKAITLDKATEAFEMTNRVGMKFAVNFIIGHQEETYDRAMDSIKYAKSIPVDYVNFSNMIPYPGTEIYKWIEANEKTGRARFLVPKEEFLKNSTTKLGLPVFETREFKYDERVKALKMGRALAQKKHFNYRLGPTMGHFAYLASKNNKIYNALRRFATGNRVGKRMYNVVRKQYKVWE